MSDSNAGVGYPIRVVARRTGLKQDAIRAWERRHGAVTPSRSEGRHRLYSDDDIHRLQLLRRATETGHSIGRIAKLTEKELGELLEADAQDRDDPSVKPSAKGNPYVSSCLEAVIELDDERLQAEISRATVEIGRDRLVDEVLGPLIDAISRGSSESTIRPMHEHLVSSVIGGVAGSFRSAFPPSESAPRVVVSTPAHQHHELGALLAASVAASHGWRVTFLGANLPAEEIAAAVQLKSSDALALSIAFPPDDPELPDELRRIRRALPGVPILVGGGAAGAYAEVLAEIDAVVVTDFDSFRRSLDGLRWRRGGAAPGK